MKIQSLLITAVALTLGLSACNKEEDFAQQDGIPDNAVQITASIGNPFATTRSNPLGTPEEQTKFDFGDEIVVENTKGDQVIYKFDGSQWIPIDNKHLLWNDKVESFFASYPEYESGIYIDQSSLYYLNESDAMTATLKDVQKGESLDFVMERQTSRIIINIAGFSSEFPSDSRVNSVMIPADFTWDDYNRSFILIPYAQGVEGSIGKVGTTYTLLLGGVGIFTSKYISLSVGEKEMRSADLPDMDFGKSYTYNLKVGKEKIEIESVTVADWTTKDVIIPGGQAEELN